MIAEESDAPRPRRACAGSQHRADSMHRGVTVRRASPYFVTIGPAMVSVAIVWSSYGMCEGGCVCVSRPNNDEHMRPMTCQAASDAAARQRGRETEQRQSSIQV